MIGWYSGLLVFYIVYDVASLRDNFHNMYLELFDCQHERTKESKHASSLDYTLRRLNQLPGKLRDNRLQAARLFTIS
jgi:hypothetical protein